MATGSEWTVFKLKPCEAQPPVLSPQLTYLLQDLIAEDPTTHGAMYVPFILGSDKTTVSVATGQNEYYPLYVSLGNVHNGVRRAHRGAVHVLAFLAIAKGVSSH